jgi:triacylglycerol lipase
MTSHTFYSSRGRRSPFASPFRAPLAWPFRSPFRAPFDAPFTSPFGAGAAGLAGDAVRAWRPVAEFWALLQDPVYWGWGVPRGDRHSVVLLPGLFAGDRSLEPLRRWLWRVGYRPVRSGLDRNSGWSEELVDEIGGLVQREFERSGRRVTIIGQSMGGLLGRSVAIRRPHTTRHVIALGSPLRMSRGQLPENVLMTAIYSRDDRIVRYPGALAQDPGARNLEVRGSHIGLAVNPAVYRRLGHALAEAQEDPAKTSPSTDQMV